MQFNHGQTHVECNAHKGDEYEVVDQRVLKQNADIFECRHPVRAGNKVGNRQHRDRAGFHHRTRIGEGAATEPADLCAKLLCEIEDYERECPKVRQEIHIPCHADEHQDDMRPNLAGVDPRTDLGKHAAHKGKAGRHAEQGQRIHM